jgi:hypothetical protein
MIITKANCLSFFFVFLISPSLFANQYSHLFSPSPPPFKHERITTNSTRLLQAAKVAHKYFKSKNKKDVLLTKRTAIPNRLISHKKANETLAFIIKTIEEDKQKRKKRILSPHFIERHFNFVKWSGDQKAAKRNEVFIPKWPDGGRLKPGRIKITNYAVFTIKGSPVKTKTYPCALYEIKSSKFKETYRLLFTKQQILKGILEKPHYKKGVRPLVWVTRKGLEEATMQGTALVVMPNGRKRYINVHLSNKMKYDKKIKSRKEQRGYWYFKDVTKRQKRDLKIIDLGKTIFAGDLAHLGLGKVIALRYTNPLTNKNEVRIGVLADSGSAFFDNLYQLDLYAGIFKSRKAFNKQIRSLPNTAEAYILVKK